MILHGRGTETTIAIIVSKQYHYGYGKSVISIIIKIHQILSLWKTSRAGEGAAFQDRQSPGGATT